MTAFDKSIGSMVGEDTFSRILSSIRKVHYKYFYVVEADA